MCASAIYNVFASRLTILRVSVALRTCLKRDRRGVGMSLLLTHTHIYTHKRLCVREDSTLHLFPLDLMIVEETLLPAPPPLIWQYLTPLLLSTTFTVREGDSELGWWVGNSC